MIYWGDTGFSRELVSASFCCITNHPETEQLYQSFIDLMTLWVRRAGFPVWIYQLTAGREARLSHIWDLLVVQLVAGQSGVALLMGSVIGAGGQPCFFCSSSIGFIGPGSHDDLTAEPVGNQSQVHIPSPSMFFTCNSCVE